MYSDMSMRTIARSSSNRNSASARASSVLPTPVGPRNRNEPIGRFGIREPGTRTPDRVRDRDDRLVLTDDALVQMLFEPHELRHLAFHEARDGNAGPLGDDLGDVFLVDLFLQHATVALEVVELRRAARRARARPPGCARSAAARPVRGRRRARRARPRAAPPRAAPCRPGSRRSRPSPTASARPCRRAPPAATAAPRRALPAAPASLVGLLRERGALDLELTDAPLDHVDLERHRVDLDAQARRRLVDEVDRLVGQLAAGDVAVGQHRGRDDRRVLDAHAVVHLVALLQAAQDRDRVLDRRLAHVHLLEAALERGVLLDVLAVLVERRRADEAQLAAGEHRLDHVAGVDRAFGAARADDRVDLVDERDDLALGVGDLLQHRLEPLLELAAVLRARDQRTDVERDARACCADPRERRLRRCGARALRRSRSCRRRARR